MLWTARLMEGFMPVVIEKWAPARWQAAMNPALLNCESARRMRVPEGVTR